MPRAARVPPGSYGGASGETRQPGRALPSGPSGSPPPPEGLPPSLNSLDHSQDRGGPIVGRGASGGGLASRPTRERVRGLRRRVQDFLYHVRMSHLLIYEDFYVSGGSRKKQGASWMHLLRLKTTRSAGSRRTSDPSSRPPAKEVSNRRSCQTGLLKYGLDGFALARGGGWRAAPHAESPHGQKRIVNPTTMRTRPGQAPLRERSVDCGSDRHGGTWDGSRRAGFLVAPERLPPGTPPHFGEGGGARVGSPIGKAGAARESNTHQKV